MILRRVVHDYSTIVLALLAFIIVAVAVGRSWRTLLPVVLEVAVPPFCGQKLGQISNNLPKAAVINSND